MQRIFLIGYMGAGKTSVGVILAKKLGLAFIDLDHFIEKRYSRTVSRLFAERGEEEFRKIEAKVLDEIADFEDVVISTGGGAPCFHDNMRRMNEAGTSIYLKTAPGLLAKRLNACKHSRPLIKNKTNEELKRFVEESLAKREPYYSLAQIVLDVEDLQTDADVELIALKLTDLLKNRESNGYI